MATRLVLSLLVVLIVSEASCGYLRYPPTCPNLPPPPPPACAPLPKFISESAVNVPLPVPQVIPLGRFCNCQTIALRPSLVAPPACVTTTPAPAPTPVPCAPAPPSIALPPQVLQALLSNLYPNPCPPTPPQCSY
ncbi:uncharacterized protein LOC132701798 [Cylas formicarius]|uniref:uncharacterized protein LOC132701798 n=1 Tax=Cylas formicarius TaxID=197179 RepID=UPI002958DD4E|nr:uncharacterized protein LOC132701798 [Cylas formicarius]